MIRRELPQTRGAGLARRLYRIEGTSGELFRHRAARVELQRDRTQWPHSQKRAATESIALLIHARLPSFTTKAVVDLELQPKFPVRVSALRERPEGLPPALAANAIIAVTRAGDPPLRLSRNRNRDVWIVNGNTELHLRV
jgi:hypothetical protein